MGLARKMKRTKVVEAAKVVKKEIGSDIKAQKTGRMIANMNIPAIDDFALAFYMPVFTYILYKDFGFGYRRLMRCQEELIELRDTVMKTLKADKLRAMKRYIPERGGSLHHYINPMEIMQGLYDECGFKFKFPEAGEAPEIKDVEHYAAWHAKHKMAEKCGAYQLILLWVLHTRFDFGKKRLEKFSNAVISHDCLGRGRYFAMLQEVEEKCHWGKDRISFDWARKKLKELGVEKTDFELNLYSDQGKDELISV